MSEVKKNTNELLDNDNTSSDNKQSAQKSELELLMEQYLAGKLVLEPEEDFDLDLESDFLDLLDADDEDNSGLEIGDLDSLLIDSEETSQEEAEPEPYVPKEPPYVEGDTQRMFHDIDVSLWPDPDLIEDDEYFLAKFRKTKSPEAALEEEVQEAERQAEQPETEKEEAESEPEEPSSQIETEQEKEPADAKDNSDEEFEGRSEETADEDTEKSAEETADEDTEKSVEETADEESEESAEEISASETVDGAEADIQPEAGADEEKSADADAEPETAEPDTCNEKVEEPDSADAEPEESEPDTSNEKVEEPDSADAEPETAEPETAETESEESGIENVDEETEDSDTASVDEEEKESDTSPDDEEEIESNDEEAAESDDEESTESDDEESTESGDEESTESADEEDTDSADPTPHFEGEDSDEGILLVEDAPELVMDSWQWNKYKNSKKATHIEKNTDEEEGNLSSPEPDVQPDYFEEDEETSLYKFNETDGMEYMSDAEKQDEEAYQRRRAARKKAALVKKKRRAVIAEILDWIIPVAVAVVLVLLLKSFVIINARIPSGSMENTIMTGDNLLGYRLAYKTKEPERGDIIIFYYPDDESQKYIKRVIGLPGEKVVIQDAKIYIDGSQIPLQEDYLKEEWTVATGYYEFEVPEDSYLMLGDNRNRSEDARYWNNKYVSKDKIIGKALWVYFPFSHWGGLD